MAINCKTHPAKHDRSALALGQISPHWQAPFDCLNADTNTKPMQCTGRVSRKLDNELKLILKIGKKKIQTPLNCKSNILDTWIIGHPFALPT